MKQISKRHLWLGITLLILAAATLSSELSKTSTLISDDSPQIFLPIIVQEGRPTPLSEEVAPIITPTLTITDTSESTVVWPQIIRSTPSKHPVSNLPAHRNDLL